ncbi:hypothetical protein PGTUg99_001714 [Puccinia graminis f. sp. tritici]|uniref:Uncharacterized protein n=1 Tax=Puccinia graminis f. sp. tritici TaxID=56615 RepID=A0A5B0S772_PUCGR|nr:hypothetical protein PGTUg99_003108 [Puccinia graminis f. sp. tritici]KAA1133720.1 hypothetical protein PGTUg99_001714 [Puccinia graminis f. sp. tritici]
MLGSSKIQLCLIARVAAQLTKDDPNGFSMYTHSIIGVIRLSLTAHESRIVLPTLVTFTNTILSSRKMNATNKSNNSISSPAVCFGIGLNLSSSTSSKYVEGDATTLMS